TFGATVTKMTQEQIPLPLVLSPIIHGLVNLFFAVHRERLFTTQTVGELIIGKRIGMLDTITTLLKPLDWFGITLEEFPKEAIPPNNEFGLLAGRNDTPEGPYEVYTGLTDAGPVLQFVSYKDQKKLKWWKGDRCNQINGSDGSLFKAGLQPEDKLYAFAADICRSAALIYVRESEFMGIPSFRYEGDPIFMDAHAPENECFCMYKNENKCKIDGLFDLSHCQFGAPLLLTSPHFIFFPDLQKNIDGLTPNIDDHMTYVEVQPTLGAVLYGIKRIMFVIRVENNPGIRNIRNNFIPFVWAEESGGLNDELANQLLYSFVYPVRGASAATAGIGVAGIATIVTALGRKYYNRAPKTGAAYGPNIYDDKTKRTTVKDTNE
ncbi:CD36-like protein 5, partial [Leptotrombidium deliense]